MVKFDGNIRTTKVLSDDELRDSMKGGWDKDLPAIKDENGVLFVGHRRIRIAFEEGIDPVIKVVAFGTGPEAEAARVRLANVSNIGGAPLTQEDRQRQAERLYESGLTMEAIAGMLGVSRQTIGLDLEDFANVSKVPRIDRLGRKNTGRPKGSGKPRSRTVTSDVEQAVASFVLDEGKTLEQAATAFGLGSVQPVKTAVAREEGRRDPQIDRADLSLTAQQKLDTAIRQHKAKLDANFLVAVNTKVKEFVDDTILPEWKRKIAEAHKLYEKRKALMNKDTFNTIRRALHPDSRQSISDRKLGDAFDAFMGLEKYLLDEKDSPTEFGGGLPRTHADWEAAKRKAATARKAKHAKRSIKRR